MLMSDLELSIILHALFCTFNRREPAASAPIYEALKKVVQNESIDAAATTAIAEAMTNLDGMPSNIGKALKNAWYDWRAKNVRRTDAQLGCWRCANDYRGYIFYRKDRYSYVGRCVCNTDKRSEFLPVVDEAFLQRVGGRPLDRKQLSEEELAKFKVRFNFFEKEGENRFRP